MQTGHYDILLQGSTQRVIVSNLTTPSAIAVDWISQKLYFADSSHNSTIEVAELDGSKRSVVVYGNLQQLRDLVVHPVAGYGILMYCVCEQ